MVRHANRFLEFPPQANRFGERGQPYIFYAGAGYNDPAKSEEPSENALLKANLFDRAQLHLFGGAADKSMTVNEPLIGDGNLLCPDRDHNRQEDEDAEHDQCCLHPHRGVS